MKNIICFSGILFLVTGLYAQNDSRRLDSLLQTCFKADQPGAVAVISKKNKLLLKKGYGLANLQTGEAISSSTNFNIGSITKQFTAFAIMQLVRQHKCSLRDKLIQYFPDFNPVTGRTITIEQLLTHRSGIIDHYAFTDTAGLQHATNADVLKAVKNIDSTYFIPGSRYRYSNTAYCLLALIVEQLSGSSYHKYIQKNIFLPLAMRRSAVLKTGQPISKSAYGYAYDSSRKTFSKLDAAESVFFSTEGDGGIYTSADEYLRWWQYLQKPSAADKPIIAQARSAQWMINPLQQLGYGYGWFVSNSPTGTAVYHTGSNGGFRAIVFTIPSEDYMVAVFSNRTGVDMEKLVQQINDILHVTNNSFTKIEALVSFIKHSPIFAPCKETL
jgi:D-alanyl-D-alanine carboxypeptidase